MAAKRRTQFTGSRAVLDDLVKELGGPRHLHSVWGWSRNQPRRGEIRALVREVEAPERNAFIARLNSALTRGRYPSAVNVTGARQFSGRDQRWRAEYLESMGWKVVKKKWRDPEELKDWEKVNGRWRLKEK